MLPFLVLFLRFASYLIKLFILIFETYTVTLFYYAGTKRMEYKGKHYHESCFCCTACEAVIGKKSFVENDGGYFCEDCFKTKLANKCAKCKKVVKV